MMDSKNLDDKIAEMEKRIAYFEKAERRAEILSSSIPNSELFVGMCGVTIELDSFDIVDDLVKLRKVTNQPGLVHICQAANHQHSDYLSVGRYSSSISAEIAVGNKGRTNSYQEKVFLFNIAWHTVALIKLRGHNTVFCPVAANESWDTQCLISDNSVDFHILDDTPRQITFRKPSSVLIKEDVEWVKSVWSTALSMRDRNHSQRFGLAFNIMYKWNHTDLPPNLVQVRR
jgi:hypothetical protein